MKKEELREALEKQLMDYLKMATGENASIDDKMNIASVANIVLRLVEISAEKTDNRAD